MEDAATAEISRSQVWSWLAHGLVTTAEVEAELAAVDASAAAKQVFARVAAASELVEFFTLAAYAELA
jgi:malate synthase